MQGLLYTLFVNEARKRFSFSILKEVALHVHRTVISSGTACEICGVDLISPLIVSESNYLKWLIKDKL